LKGYIIISDTINNKKGQYTPSDNKSHIYLAYMFRINN
jgi:hypothetical protein